MIDSINIRNVATYDETGIQIKDLKKVNFIYGANGSGKTTISNFLYNPEDENFSDCSLTWKNSQPITTLVYNKNFRERNFGKGKLKGVFTIGEATADEIKILEEQKSLLGKKKEDISQKKNIINNKQKSIDDIENAFSLKCWDNLYKKHKSYFKEAFIGNSSSKIKFKEKLILEYSNNKASYLDIEQLKIKAQTIFGKTPTVIEPIEKLAYDRIQEIESNSIWKKNIVSKSDVDIAKFINKMNIIDWVNQGKNYLDEEDDICPFCQQRTISADFRHQLESFFDETYLSNTKLIKELIFQYSTAVSDLMNFLESIEINQKSLDSTKLDLDKFSMLLKSLKHQIATNKERMLNKEKELSRDFELISSKEQFDLICGLINVANVRIEEHNTIVNNLGIEKRNLIDCIWKFMINDFSFEIKTYKSEISNLSKAIGGLNEKIRKEIADSEILERNIKALSKNVTSIQPTVNDINDLLESYGFTNFKIVSNQENGFYHIQREDGSIAETTLSEGEITFITFLYFLQLSKGGISEDTVNDERVLVIDDPISSLDSNVLFIISMLIKEIIKDIKSDTGDIKQLILLTHNVYFHKEVSYINCRTKKCNKINYWILRRDESVTKVKFYNENNPIQTSYELLWNELKSNEIKSSISIQNTMRRIIETYFKIIGNYVDDDLIKKFKNKNEQIICKSLLSWINDGSHCVPDSLCIEFPDKTIEVYHKVFQNIFRYTNNEGHYNMMMGIDELASV